MLWRDGWRTTPLPRLVTAPFSGVLPVNNDVNDLTGPEMPPASSQARKSRPAGPRQPASRGDAGQPVPRGDVGHRAADPADLLSRWFRRVVNSDEGAFESLFRTLHDDLLRYTRRLVGDDATARDVVQETFVRFWERRREHDPSGSVRALLHRTARNLALNHLRDGRRREELLAAGYEPPQTPSPGPDASLVGQELAHRIQGWIETLPPRQREALTLSRFHGLPHEEIAEVMELSPRTVNNHLVRALRTLKDRIDQDGPSPRSER